MDNLFKAKFDFGSAPCAEGYTKVSENAVYDAKTGYGFVFDTDENGNNMINIKSADRGGDSLKRDFCFADRHDVPLRFDVDVPHNGTYNVKLLIGDYAKDTKVTVQSEARRFIINNKSVKKGEFIEAEFTVNVCDRKFRDEDYVTDNTLNIAVIGDNACLNSLSIEEVADAVTIYIAGDSTVTDQSANYPYNPKSTYCGWGQMLGQFLKKGVCVSNHAQSGSTTQAFMENNWTVVKERIKKGDFLFIQFGHNDQKEESLGAYTGYADNLRYYIDYVRSIGANPVVCTPINRIIFEEDGSLRDLLGEYGSAVRSVCKEKNVPFIDLLKKTTEYFEATGDVDSWGYFWGDGTNRDYTHTNDIGGNLIAKFVAQGIVDNQIEPICNFIKADEIKVDMPKKKKAVKKHDDNSKELSAVKNIGLVNLPKFKDIAGLENEDKIRELSAKGILDSADDGIFGADREFTVKSAVYWAVRAAGVKAEDTSAFAMDKKWIGEISEHTPVTRERLAVLLIHSYNYRAPDRAIVGNIDQYSDRDLIDADILDFVRAANELGVLRGVSENEYAPKKTMTRGQAIDIFYKLIKTN